MGFVLPVLEYCSAVWCSAADTHLRLLDRVVSGASFLTGGVFACDLVSDDDMKQSWLLSGGMTSQVTYAMLYKQLMLLILIANKLFVTNNGQEHSTNLEV